MEGQESLYVVDKEHKICPSKTVFYLNQCCLSVMSIQSPETIKLCYNLSVCLYTCTSSLLGPFILPICLSHSSQQFYFMVTILFDGIVRCKQCSLIRMLNRKKWLVKDICLC